jgi:hypothetical protein
MSTASRYLPGRRCFLKVWAYDSSAVEGRVDVDSSHTHSVHKQMTGLATSNESNTQLSGIWLILARSGFLEVFAFSLIVFIGDIPGYFGQLEVVCRSSACTLWQLTPDSLSSLTQLGLSAESYAFFSILLGIFSLSIWLSIALIIAWRRSTDWLAILVAMQLVTTGVAGQSNLDFQHFGNLLAPNSSVWFGPTMLVYFLAFFLFFVMFLLFPNGRFVPRWMYWILILGIASTGFVCILFLSQASFSRWLPAIIFVALALVAVSAVLAQLYRYRFVSTPAQRQQTKWIVLGIFVGLVAAFGPYVPSLFFSSFDHPGLFYIIVKPISLLLLLFGPLSWGVAMFRYHLWDIDVLINQTLVYATLTGILALVYISSTVLLQNLLRGIIHQESAIAIVVSTLVIASLFQPLRRLIQENIDRRFYRPKYDAAKALGAFTATLRHEVDLDQLRDQLVHVVDETMQPAQAFLWLRPGRPEPAATKQAHWTDGLDT